MTTKKPPTTTGRARMGRRVPIIDADQQAKVERDATDFLHGNLGTPPNRITVTIAGPQGAGKTWLREVLEGAIKASAGFATSPLSAAVHFIEVQTDAAPAVGDAMDLETINAALQEQLEQSLATGATLERMLREWGEVSSLFESFGRDMAGRLAAALCVAGLIDACEVEGHSEEEMSRIDVKVARLRARHRGGPMAADGESPF